MCQRVWEPTWEGRRAGRASNSHRGLAEGAEENVTSILRSQRVISHIL
jgi:hypothetical protein